MADMDLNQLAKVIEQSFKRALKETGAAGNLNDSRSSSAVHGRGRVKDEVLGKSQKAVANFEKSIKAFSNEIKDLTSATSKMNAAQLSAHNKKLNAATKDLAESYNNQMDSLEIASGSQFELARSIASLTKAYKNGDASLQSLDVASAKLVKSYLRSAESYGSNDRRYKAAVEQMKNSASKMSSSFLEAGNLWDEHTQTIKKNLRPSDFQALRNNIGLANSVIRESFGKLGTKGLEAYAGNASKLQLDLNKPASEGEASGESLRDKLLTSAIALEKLNFHKFNTKLEGANTDFAALAQEMSVFHNSLRTATEEMHTHVVNGPGKMASFIEKHVTPRMADLAKEGATAAAALAALKTGYAVAEDFIEYHKVGIADDRGYGERTLDQFFTKNGFLAGMDATSYAKTVQDPNRKTINAMGATNFDSVVTSYMSQMKQFGIATLKEDTESLKAMIGNSKAIGVDNSNVAALNDYIKDTTDEFASLRHILGGTVADFERHNAELLSSTDIANSLNAMGKEQGATYIKNLKLERDDILAKTQSIELANQMVKAQEAASRASIDDRFKGSAGIMLMGQATGASSQDVMKAMRIHQAGNAASSDEKTWLTKYMMAQGVADQKLSDKNKGKGSTNTAAVAESFNIETLRSSYLGMLDTNLRDQMGGGLQANAAVKSGLAQLPDQMQQNAALAAGKNKDGSDGAEKTMLDAALTMKNAVESFKGLIDGPVGTAIKSLGILAGTVVAGKAVSSVLGSLGAAGAAGAAGAGAAEVAGGVAAGGVAAKALKVVKTGAQITSIAGRAAVTGGLMAAAPIGVDAIAGKFGYGKDANGNAITVNTEQDDANWKAMNWWQKGVSGVGRGIEKAGSFLWMDNLARQAQADRIASETAYLRTPTIQAPGVQNPTVDTTKVSPSAGKPSNVNTQQPAAASPVQPVSNVINPSDEAVAALKNIDKYTVMNSDILWQILAALKDKKNGGPSMGRASSAYVTGR